MADMKVNKITISNDIVQSLLDAHQREGQMTQTLMDNMHKAFSHLTDVDNAVVLWEMTTSCPCKLETKLVLKENEGGMTWNIQVCDLCDYDHRAEKSDEISDAIGKTLSAWTNSVGKKHLIKAIARATGGDVQDIGVTSDPDSMELIRFQDKKVKLYENSLRVCVDMLDDLISMIDRKRLSKDNFAKLQDILMTKGAIIAHIFNEGIMDPNKQASAKDVARKLIDSIDGESEGKNAN